MKAWTMAALAVVSLAGAQSSASLSFRDGAIGELNSMRFVYENAYAPAEWKKTLFGYSLESEYQKALAGLNATTLSQRDAREIFKNFIYAMRDYHTSVSFVSTESATLPLVIQGSGDRFFIVSIDRTQLGDDAFPFSVGDEVVTFDDQPTAAAVAAVQAQTPAIVPETDRAMAELSLTKRSSSRGATVPRGPVSLGIKRKGETTVSSVQLLWTYKEEKVAQRGVNVIARNGGRDASEKSAIFSPVMNVDVGPLAATAPEAGDERFTIGGRKTFTPDLGAKIWESDKDSEFYAYIYKAPDRRLVGYVRIPSYVPSKAPKALADFASIVQRFEESTDGMIVDEVNNPGGSVSYLYSLTSMLALQPLRTPRHRMTLTQLDVKMALALIAKLENVKTEEDAKKAFGPDDDDFTPSLQAVQFTLDYARFTLSEWNAGKSITSPYWIGGADHVNPAKTHYTKPILLLVNHLDFSGGDFFPAILQDNKRVTVMGSRTSGAGGYVRDVSIPNAVGVDSFRVTASIAVRVDGHPIENLGITPDLPYEMSVEDYQQNFAPYANAIRSAMTGLMK